MMLWYWFMMLCAFLTLMGILALSLCKAAALGDEMWEKEQ